jgi:hypothetical protein
MSAEQDPDIVYEAFSIECQDGKVVEVNAEESKAMGEACEYFSVIFYAQHH